MVSQALTSHSHGPRVILGKMSKNGLPSYLNTKLKIHSSAGPYFGTSVYMLLCDNENKMFGEFIAEVN